MFEYSKGPLRDVLRTPWGRPEPTFKGSPFKSRLEHPLDVILGRLRDVIISNQILLYLNSVRYSQYFFYRYQIYS